MVYSPAILDDQQSGHHCQRVDIAERRCTSSRGPRPLPALRSQRRRNPSPGGGLVLGSGGIDFVAAHLHLSSRHSVRTYALAWELKAAGLDWRGAVVGRSSAAA
jgi:hypothetical protein